MIFNRLFKPQTSTILYHYCSVDTLLAIAEHKRIRFSDINMMNDYNESRYTYELFEEAASLILNDASLRKKFPKIDKEYFDRVDEIIAPQQLFLHPTIACFSKSPDVLSQWRGYADEATGVAIGIHSETLGAMPVSMLEVEYERTTQLDEMKTALIGMYLMEADRGFKWGKEFVDGCVLLASWGLGFKADAFKEEQEVRLLHLLTVDNTDNRPRLEDPDEEDEGGKIVRGQTVKFRVSDRALVAYIDIPLPDPKGVSLIPELWVGPKNHNGPGNLLYLLGGHGISGTELKFSNATFR